jgi:hypothetical protein
LVVWVAQVASYAAGISVGAPWAEVSLTLLATLALFPKVSGIVGYGVGILAKGAKGAGSRGLALFASGRDRIIHGS